ncbi:MAG: ribosome recycling factor [Planctomycetota bacterium]|nr:ribosome recycling factor [Planctomycetota bacterium]
MAAEDILLESEDKMDKAVEHLRQQYRTVRTGRASAGLVEHLRVDYYGSPTELRQLATITVPDPLMIVIKPYDPGSIGDISKGIQASDLGITPMVEGKVIRLAIPPLSEERRKQIVHQIKEMAEETKVSLRNIRRDSIKHVDAEEKAKALSEDDAQKARDDATDMVHEHEKAIDEALKHKTAEIMEV